MTLGRTPRAVRGRGWAIPLVIALSVVVGIGGIPHRAVSEPVLLAMPAAKTPAAEEVAAVREMLHALVNAERTRNGLAPLAADHRLHGSAQLKAADMARFDYFGHTNPYDGKFGPRYVMETGIGCRSAGEIILTSLADGNVHRTAARAVNAWMESAPHREAILNAKYGFTGFGMSNGYFVGHFCGM